MSKYRDKVMLRDKKINSGHKKINYSKARFRVAICNDTHTKYNKVINIETASGKPKCFIYRPTGADVVTFHKDKS